jgi:HK97 family phage prohead protease
MKETRSAKLPNKIEGRKITGLAATYDNPTIIRDRTGREFSEVIRRGAFTQTLQAGADVRALFNHNPDLGVLGRTKSGTLKLWEDERGLAFECELPDTALGNSIATSIQRGDLDGCSFAFAVTEEIWSEGPMREVRILDLFDVSVVTYPAYDHTELDLRSVNTNANQWKYSLMRKRLELLDK